MKSTFPERQIDQASEINELIELAQRIYNADQLHIDDTFADQLEQRILDHAALSQVHRSSWTRFWQMHKVLVAAVSLGLVLLLLCLGTLVAFQSTGPTRPHPSLTQGGSPHPGEPTVFASSPVDQAMLDIQAVRHSLNALVNLTNTTQTSEYIETIDHFNQQVMQADSDVQALPAGPQKNDLSAQLAGVKNEARHQFYTLLPTLSSDAGSATTQALGQLGDPIPQLTGATLVLSDSPQGNATVVLMGSGLQSGAKLLVNGKATSVTGTLQDGQLLFVLPWRGDQHPHSLGIQNPNGTIAQTGSITVQKPDSKGKGHKP